MLSVYGNRSQQQTDYHTFQGVMGKIVSRWLNRVVYLCVRPAHGWRARCPHGSSGCRWSRCCPGLHRQRNFQKEHRRMSSPRRSATGWRGPGGEREGLILAGKQWQMGKKAGGHAVSLSAILTDPYKGKVAEKDGLSRCCPTMVNCFLINLA